MLDFPSVGVDVVGVDAGGGPDERLLCNHESNEALGSPDLNVTTMV